MLNKEDVGNDCSYNSQNEVRSFHVHFDYTSRSCTPPAACAASAASDQAWTHGTSASVPPEVADPKAARARTERVVKTMK